LKRPARFRLRDGAEALEYHVYSLVDCRQIIGALVALPPVLGEVVAGHDDTSGGPLYRCRSVDRNCSGGALDEVLEGTEFAGASVEVLPEYDLVAVISVKVHAAAFALGGSPNCLSEMPAAGEDL